MAARALESDGASVASVPASAVASLPASTVALRSLVILKHPAPLFERDRSRRHVLTVVVGVPAGVVLKEAVPLSLHLVHATEDLRAVVPAMPATSAVDLLPGADDAMPLCLGPDQRTCSVKFRVNALSGKGLFRLGVRPLAHDAPLGGAFTNPFRVVTKLVAAKGKGTKDKESKEGKEGKGMEADASAEASLGMAGGSAVGTKRGRPFATTTAAETVVSPSAKRVRSGGGTELDQVVAQRLGEVAVALVRMTQQQAALVRAVLDLAPSAAVASAAVASAASGSVAAAAGAGASAEAPLST